MNDQHCNEATAWTCRQTALSQEYRTIHSVDESSSCALPAGAMYGENSVQSFVPGVVALYLTHQDLPLTRELAVLFVDLANSTRILSQQAPTHALTLIQHFTELVTEIAVAHCGDVKDYEGDGALLYFASITQATQAALAMRTAFAVLQTKDGQGIQARFSLNVGEVTIGVIGSVLRRSVALIGPTVQLAARLLKHVAPGGIIAPQTVIERLQQEAPTLARDFHLQGTCLTVRDFEEQCVTAYALPTKNPASSVQSQKIVVSGQRSVISREQEDTQKLKVPDPCPLPPDPYCLFRREGDYWTLSFAGVTCRLKDTRGLHYVAHLLRYPHQEFHSLVLLSEQTTLDGEATRVSSVQTSDFSHGYARVFGDAGSLLDPQACAAYKHRIMELRTDLDEARRFNDLGRVEKLQAELSFLMQELARDVGLGGRARKAGSIAERARVKVTKAIKIALRRVTENHSKLGFHLSTTLKTGTYCSYAPDTRLPITWQT
jgi:class 3 adenylate cyclase